jgi:RNA polymerase sigma-70 factor (family 1)
VSAFPAYIFASSSDPDGSQASPAQSAHDAESVRLVTRLHRDDEHALVEIILRYRGVLHAFLLRGFRLEPADADDVLQRVFYNLWTHRAALSTTTPLRGYLFTSTRNHALNFVRDTRYDREHHTEITEALAIAIMETTMEARDLSDAVHQAIDRLPARGREIFLLSRDGGLSYPEIAHTLGITLNTVKTHMTRALATLARAAAPFLSLLVIASR